MREANECGANDLGNLTGTEPAGKGKDRSSRMPLSRVDRLRTKRHQPHVTNRLRRAVGHDHLHAHPTRDDRAVVADRELQPLRRSSQTKSASGFPPTSNFNKPDPFTATPELDLPVAFTLSVTAPANAPFTLNTKLRDAPSANEDPGSNPDATDTTFFAAVDDKQQPLPPTTPHSQHHPWLSPSPSHPHPHRYLDPSTEQLRRHRHSKRRCDGTRRHEDPQVVPDQKLFTATPTPPAAPITRTKLDGIPGHSRI